jgi:hypothetical protein
LREYINTIASYEPHRITVDPTLREQIDAQLEFAFSALGYEPGVGVA